MTYEEIIKEVENGAKFTVNFEKRTCKVNGKVVVSEDDTPLPGHPCVRKIIMLAIERRYAAYKRSVPSERSESHRKSYFKALPEKSLSDEDMSTERRERSHDASWSCISSGSCSAGSSTGTSPGERGSGSLRTTRTLLSSENGLSQSRVGRKASSTRFSKFSNNQFNF